MTRVSVLAKLFQALMAFYPWRKGRKALVRLFYYLTRPFGAVFVPSAYGPLLRLRNDYSCIASVIGHKGDRVFAELSELIQMEGPCALLDIGANVGVFSLALGSRLPEDALVLAFELNPVIYEDLVLNIGRNGLQGKVLPFNLGVGAEARAVRFTYRADHSGQAHIDAHGTHSGHVIGRDQMAELQALWEGRKLFVKIDVEGAELEVLRGIEPILVGADVRKLVVEVSNRHLARFGTDAGALYAFLDVRGYAPKYAALDGQHDQVFIPTSAGA